ncbi:hypothetical protein B0H21DRAFT_824081 [Amylocystis lapponica]|nr:hypothetical protein B0H21DRAFT_824081 [Amylocystis lapponica]
MSMFPPSLSDASDSVSPTLRDVPLTPTMNRVMDDCPKFRVLVVGKSGVGKSSLINAAFKCTLANVSEHQRGISSIEDEITSESNQRFVLHDSQGYEPGEVENFRILEEFIKWRTQETDVSKKLHAIWLCISTPFAGGRVFETGDEKIFDIDRGNVPIIVVFTRFDELVARVEGSLMKGDRAMNGTKLTKKAKEDADIIYKDVCTKKLKARLRGRVPPHLRVSNQVGYEDTLTNLIQITMDQMRFGPHASHTLRSKSTFLDVFRRASSKSSVTPFAQEPEEGLNATEVMFATAQGVDLQSKIDASIDVGRQKYWRGLASSANFFGKTLKACLDALHTDIVIVWNFSGDVGEYLGSDPFKIRFYKVIEDLIDRNAASPNAELGMSNIAARVGDVVELAADIGHPEALIVAPIVVGVIVAKWLYDVYKATPGTLRSLMAYIVDLAIVMQRLFELARPSDSEPLSRITVDKVLDDFDASNEKREIHDLLRLFAETTNLFQAMDKDRVFEKVVSLIKDYARAP